MSSLVFLGYKIVESHLKLHAGSESGEVKEFKITPKVKIDLRQSDKYLILNANVVIESNEEARTPFDLNITLSSQFEIKEKTDIETLRVESSAFIFPYLRQAVSMLTMSANIPPYFLPIIDFSLEKSREKDRVIVRPIEGVTI